MPPIRAADFLNARQAYGRKGVRELALAWGIFRFCACPPLVKHCEQLLGLSSKVLGKRLTNGIVKRTFFKHFCAGEDSKSVQEYMRRLRMENIGGILDYAAENDLPAASDGHQPKEGVVSARVFDYLGEEECEKNARIILECVKTASQSSGKKQFAALKLTALGKPDCLERFSSLLLAIRRVFIAAVTDRPLSSIPLEECRLAMADIPTTLTLPGLSKGLRKLGVEMSEGELSELFRAMDVNQDGDVDYLEWTAHMSLEEFSSQPLPGATSSAVARARRNLVEQLAEKCNVKLLSKDDYQLALNLHSRLDKVAERAAEGGVRLLVDAEQSYMQVAIDHFCGKLQMRFNREVPVVYNTYQCYLKYANGRVERDLERAARGGYKFGGKLVRGAYMVQERRLAEEKGHASPIHNTKGDTDNSFNKCMEIIFDSIHRAEAIIGTHNLESVVKCTELMAARGVSPSEGGVSFGQLLGMADNLSGVMAANNYQVFKYLPYGPVEEVMPYLIRRAQENSDIMAGATEERKMIFRELIRRGISGSEPTADHAAQAQVGRISLS